jgi:UDP-N-acetylmuramate--alanine ligase
MLATIFSKSTLKGAHHIGVPDFSGLDGGMFNGTDYIIVEADEYATNPHVDNTPRFAFQHPNILACTNIDYDHPDIYKNLEAVQKVFGEFMLATLNNGGKVVYCGDDSALSKVVAELPKDNIFSYGTSESNDLVISLVQDNANETSFQCKLRGEDLGKFHIELSGQHNILNAACAILVSYLSKIEMSLIRDGLAQFTGSKRRFELITSRNNTYLYDDYAHHPKEITAVIEAARHKFPDNRILVIFQPHTFSRTNALATEFAEALQTADEHYVLSIFSSEREKEDSLTTSELGKLYNSEELVSTLKTKDLRNTTLITMGAGNVYDMHTELKNILAQNS